MTPLALPLSSALYGRTGLVSKFDASDWRIFDATDPAARVAYATGFEFNRLSLTWFVRFAKYRLYELSCIVSPKASEQIVEALKAWCGDARENYRRRAEVAKALGVSRGLVGDWLAGRALPGLDVCLELQAFLKKRTRAKPRGSALG